MSPLLQENGRPAAYVGDVNSLVWNFISFPRKPSYSASFLHWIFSLSYPYLTTLYIFNSIISWSPKPSPLRIPWIHRGWTPVTHSNQTDRKTEHYKQEKKDWYIKNPHKVVSWFFSGNCRPEVCGTFKSWKKPTTKNTQQGTQMKSFMDKQKLKEFSSTKPAL